MAIHQADQAPTSKGWGCLSALCSTLCSTLSSQSPLKRVLTVTLVALAALAVIGVLFSILWITSCFPLMLAHPFITLSCVLGALAAITLVVVTISRCFYKAPPPPPPLQQREPTPVPDPTITSSLSSSEEDSTVASLPEIFPAPSEIPPVDDRFRQCVDEICRGSYRATHIPEPIDPKSLFDQNDLHALSYGKTLEGRRWISVKATTIQKDPSPARAHFVFIEKDPLFPWKLTCHEDREKEIDVGENEKILLLSIVKDECNYYHLKLDTEDGNESEENSEADSLET